MEDIFTCPITQELMTDPVIAADGHTYERSAITEWLTRNNTSPVTGLRLESTEMRPNIALRSAIETFKQQRNRVDQALLAAAVNANNVANTQPNRNAPNNASAVAASQPRASNILSIEVTPLSKEIQARGGTSLTKGARVSLSLPEVAESKPLFLVAVLDASGSMSLACMEDEGTEGAQFSRMDLVKHSMNTAIELLRDKDFLCLITFSNEVKTILEPTAMTLDGKRKAREAISRMQPDGTTNFWGGLNKGVAMAMEPPQAIRTNKGHCAILVLTDGQPTKDYTPPRGIVEALKSVLSRHPSLPCPLSIHCCGYGFNDDLDTSLLCDIAKIGRGTYGYVPDGSMVGTVFIHLICNLMTVVLTDVKLEVRSSDLAACRIAQNEAVLDVGFLRAGQKKSFFVPLQGLDVSKLEIVRTIHTETFSPIIDYFKPCDALVLEHVHFWFMLALEAALYQAGVNDLGHAQSIIRDLHRGLEEPAKDKTDMTLLRDDLIHPSAQKGQVFKAIENERSWKRWGQHYLPSAFLAHVRQEKSNFKDESMSLYTSPPLDDLYAKAEETFLRITPPTPSSARYSNPGYYPTQQYRPFDAAPPSIQTMMNRSAGCWTGESLVTLGDGVTQCPIRDLRKGMQVWTSGGTNVGGGGGGGIVRTVVKFHVDTKMAWICRRGMMGITPYHPVYHPRLVQWVFPIDYSQELFDGMTLEPCDVLYNLVLEGSAYDVQVEGQMCVTLGHGLNTNHVVAHEYFGTTRIVQDLQQMPGFEEGLVVFKHPEFIREDSTGRVVGIIERTRRPQGVQADDSFLERRMINCDDRIMVEQAIL